MGPGQLAGGAMKPRGFSLPSEAAWGVWKMPPVLGASPRRLFSTPRPPSSYLVSAFCVPIFSLTACSGASPRVPGAPPHPKLPQTLLSVKDNRWETGYHTKPRLSDLLIGLHSFRLIKETPTLGFPDQSFILYLCVL